MFKRITNKDIDLLVAYQRKNEASPYASLIKMAILPICLILVFASIFVVQTLRINSLDEQIAQSEQNIQNYNKKIANVGSEAYALYNEMAEKNSQIEKVIENIHSYPRLSTEVMNVFLKNLVNGLSLSSISFQEGVISISANASNVLTIENYVRTLRNTNLFLSVDYRGYQTNETVKTITSDEDKEGKEVSSKVYVFQVNCVLKGVDE
ncbi:MAG: hypothetical protein EOM50_09050 [Erysipelotrichia bacterium]|nr:hypothetical protein [Erysipelotrichia bacterium]NCC53918.1 hypothetical protein [Erysipelotrichia bacterium]